jgi:hypothetical protein
MSTVGKCDLKDSADSKKRLKKDKENPKISNEIKGYDADTEKESTESVVDNFSSLAKEIDDNVKIMSFLGI